MCFCMPFYTRKLWHRDQSLGRPYKFLGRLVYYTMERFINKPINSFRSVSLPRQEEHEGNIAHTARKHAMKMPSISFWLCHEVINESCIIFLCKKCSEKKKYMNSVGAVFHVVMYFMMLLLEIACLCSHENFTYINRELSTGCVQYFKYSTLILHLTAN